MDLSGSSAVVTGGASGLGEATAVALAEQGVFVVVLDQDAERGEAVAAGFGGAFARADVTSELEVSAAIAAATDAAPLKVLANCAGISRAARVVNRRGELFDLDNFELVLRVNLIGTFNCVRLAAKAMSANEPGPDGDRGAIINTASAAAFDGQVGQAAYSASKGGVVGLTLPLARDLADLGIRVNTIAPGLFDTPMWGKGDKGMELKQALGETVVFPKRLGHPAEFAAMAVALATNGYANGEVVRMDGGIRLAPR